MSKASLFKISATVGAAFCAQCFVAGAYAQTMPAVSAPNGKVEFSAGVLRLPTTPNFHARAAGSFSFPVTDAFGIQGDLALFNTPTGTGFGGAVHAFTRDPSRYLLGVTTAFVRVPNASLMGIGPEAELYMGQWSFEAWAGVASLNYDDPLLADVGGIFALADVAFYPTDDLRLYLGGSHVLGYNQLRLGAEYQISDFEIPFSITGDARFGQDGAIIATLGLKHYFGDPKSLIDRHRQDDPDDKPLDFYGAAGQQIHKVATAPSNPVDTTAECEALYGYRWYYNGSTCVESLS